MSSYLIGRIDLPALPLELIVQIFTHLAPQYIFSLRSVSRSWHGMLSNPHLETAIYETLPFISTAATLERRVKRSMRMLRNEPVRVEIEAAGQRLSRPPFIAGKFTRASHQTMAMPGQGALEHNVFQSIFHNGHTVVLSNPATKVDCLTIPLGIVNRQGGKVVVEIDLLEVIKSSSLEISSSLTVEPVNDAGSSPHPSPVAIEPRFLHVQEDVVAVGLEALWSQPEDPREYRSLALCFLLFSLPTGELLQTFQFDKGAQLHRINLGKFNIIYKPATLLVLDVRVNTTLLCLLSAGTETENLVIEAYSILTCQCLCTMTIPSIVYQKITQRKDYSDCTSMFALDSANNIYYPEFVSIDCVNLRVISAESNIPHQTADPLSFPRDYLSITEQCTWTTYIGTWGDTVCKLDFPVHTHSPLRSYSPDIKSLHVTYYCWKAQNPKRTMRKHTFPLSTDIQRLWSQGNTAPRQALSQPPLSTVYGIWGYVGSCASYPPKVVVLQSILRPGPTLKGCENDAVGVMVNGIFANIEILKKEKKWWVSWTEGDDGMSVWLVTCERGCKHISGSTVAMSREYYYVATIYDEDYIF